MIRKRSMEVEVKAAQGCRGQFVNLGALNKSQSCSRLHTEVGDRGVGQRIEAWGLP